MRKNLDADPTVPVVPRVGGQPRRIDLRVVEEAITTSTLEAPASHVVARALAGHARPCVEFRSTSREAATHTFRRRVRHCAARGHHVPGMRELAARLELAGGDRVWMALLMSGVNSVAIWLDDAEQLLGCVITGPVAAE